MGGKAGSGQVASLSSRTGSPSSMARLIAAIAPSTGQPSVSRPGSPAASVAVLSTGFASSTSAMRAASAFAPPCAAGRCARAGAVPAEQGDRMPAGLVYADHGRVAVLAGQQRGDQPDGRPGGQEADQRIALAPGPGQRRRRGPRVAACLPGPGPFQPLRGGLPRRRHRDQPDHARPPHPATHRPARPRSTRPGSAGQVWSFSAVRPARPQVVPGVPSPAWGDAGRSPVGWAAAPAARKFVCGIRCQHCGFRTQTGWMINRCRMGPTDHGAG